MAHLANLIWRNGRHKGLWPWLSALLMAAVIVGCGGGGSDVAGGVGVGGTGAGPVTGYGSIIVNSVRFDVAGATFTTEDATDPSEYSLYAGDESLPDDSTAERPVGIGTLVAITSGDIRRDGDDDLAAATRITLISAVRGPLEAKTSNSLTVLGQTVDVDAGTWYSPGHELAALVPNSDHVVVYAELVGERYKATRVEHRAVVLSYKLRGNIANLDQTNKTFTMGGITVDYSAARGASFIQRDGQAVRVRLLKRPQTNGAYNAVTVAPVAASATFRDGQEARLSGVATNVNLSAKTCVINGVTVNFTTANYSGGTLDNDSRIEIKGTVRNGVVVASEVVVKSQAEVEEEYSRIKLIGAMSAWTPASGGTPGTFTVKQIQVRYSAALGISGGSGGGGNATLAEGRLVEVQGRRDPSDPSVITATSIRVR